QAARAGAILGGGLALSLPQILPFLELAAYSTRTTAGAALLPPTWDAARIVLTQQLTLFAPLSWGTSMVKGGAIPPIFYLGLAPLLLALTALLLCRGRRIVFLAGAGLTAWGVAMNLPYVNLLHQLPGLQAQLPYRVGYLFIFCMAALSAFGLDAWLDLARRRPAATAGRVATLLVLALPVTQLLRDHHARDAGNPALYTLQAQGFDQATRIAVALLAWAGAVLLLRGSRGPQTRLLLMGLLIALTGGDLLTYNPDYNTYVDPATLTPHSPTADLIRRDPTGSRLMAPDVQGPNFVPNSAILYGLHDVQGYDSLHLTRYEAYWAAADPTVRGNSYFDVFLRPQNFNTAQADLLNVKYVVTGAPLDRVEQLHADRTLSELAYGPITQTFRTPDRLERLTVNFDTLGRVNHAPVTLHLRRAATDSTDLVTQTISPQGWSGQPWIKFKFAPLAVHFGEPLTLILESPTDRVGDSVAPRVSVGDAYGYGTAARRSPVIGRDFDLAFIAEGSVPAKLAEGFVGDTHVYTNTAALPRAFIVGNAAVLPAETIPARIAAPGFDPLQAVLLEQPPPPGFAQTADHAASSRPLAAGTATITRYRNLSVDVTAQLAQPGWLVLGDVNYPGWAVTVDGQPAPLYTAYYILRAVPLPAGTHQVHFYFLPLSVLLGGAVSGSTLLLILAVLYRAYSRRRRATRQGQAVSPNSPNPASAVIAAPQAKEAGR
ncbi:MAG: YfhO family protein, partial [Chloroflexota bacterium]|nr:YfhO family protein [Chloroflexota bacterium]